MTAAKPASASAIRPVLADGATWPEDAVEVGVVIDAWGVKGGLKVKPFSADPQALFCTKKWFLMPAEAAVAKPTSVTPPARAGRAPAAAASPAQPQRLSAPRFLQMRQVREQGDAIVATADDLVDRNAAEALKGARIFVSRSAFPSTSDDEFYWVDLIGLDVVNREGQHLGVVVDLLDTGPTSVLRCEATVEGSADKVERMIPFVKAYIDSVSLSERRIVADWGLDY